MRRRSVSGIEVLKTPRKSRSHRPSRRGRAPRAWMYVLPIFPLTVLAVLGLVGANMITGCNGAGPGLNIFNNPPGGRQVPIVRVKISPQASSCVVAVSGGYRVRTSGGVSGLQGRLGQTSVTCGGNVWRIGGSSYTGREITIEPVRGSAFFVGGTAYRGTLHLVAQGGDTFIAVNHVDMEDYIAGVIPKELMSGWSLETYKALAVAARTFALSTRNTSGAGRDFDLNDNESSQVYGGYTAEYTARYARQAVDATRGQVLTYGGKIFLAQYSAACGGVVNSAYVIRNAPASPPLTGGQVCNDCGECKHYRWSPVRVYKGELYQALLARYPQTAALGGVSSLAVTEWTPYGRAVWVDVIGTNGQKMRVRAEDIRLCWNMSLSGKPTATTRRLYSMNCTIVQNADSFDFTRGRGFGHGVGLCQWGAQAKAARGANYKQILGFYYPGASIAVQY